MNEASPKLPNAPIAAPAPITPIPPDAADPMRLLHGEGFTLEPMTEGHAEAMFVLLGDPELHRYTDDALPDSLDALRQRYRRLALRRSTDGQAWWLNWVIRLADGALAGYLQATVQVAVPATAQAAGHGASRADIAYVLAQAYWGKGLATRAVQCMLDELATTFHVRQLQATAALANTRSLRLLQRLGFLLGGPTDNEGDVWVGRALEAPTAPPTAPPAGPANIPAADPPHREPP